MVFSDLNRNGVQDPGEPGLSGVMITLVDPGPDGLFGTGDDTVIATATTAGDGFYAFTVMAAGEYAVQETDPGGFGSTTPNVVLVIVPGGASNVNFGDQAETPTPTPTATATPTESLCGNGSVDPGETCDPPGSLEPPLDNPCRADCTFCGDGIVNGPPSGPGHETCDPGTVPSRGCHVDCTGKVLRDPATITFSRDDEGLDRLWVHGRILPVAPIDASQVVVAVRLSNAEGLIYSAELPAHQVTRTGRTRPRFKFRNRAAETQGGFSIFRLYPSRRGGYAFRLVAWGDLSAATLPEMTVEVSLGAEQYRHGGEWRPTRRGWRDNGRYELLP